MSRVPVPFSSPDISQFARSIARQMKSHGAAPSHLELMNMLAKSSGFKNFQHLKAAHVAYPRVDNPAIEEKIDHRLLERALNQFDEVGQLVKWPGRRQVQVLCLWQMWSVIPAGTSLSEKEVNALLNGAHCFGDPALLRRELFGLGMLQRNRDGSDYRRQEQRPPLEALDLIGRLKARRLASNPTRAALSFIVRPDT
ncbi:hypothetical protein PsAD2_02770 [Pseudovibrio axinellae]|uniref:DUF2087 domain-containing protein n=1 Tax=Pseudovibrio axinellae TaxID=989403 RepID=A0A165XTY9_9HYPH|nr:DUF2087 domain-containing protein [Pseudovibrio axinellae]KZL18036.1 hypothetical protein PsAD2_02770 [Pseudovibrio axinellae]SER12707.1 hypothetical protein SAMN05421798_106210 [Pseudovibrio axinellae]